MPHTYARIPSLRVQVLGVWRSPVARYVRDVEAPGSNPGTPTIALSSLLFTIYPSAYYYGIHKRAMTNFE